MKNLYLVYQTINLSLQIDPIFNSIDNNDTKRKRKKKEKTNKI
jgi:hypothetical protein